ncbi:hypothetical protein PVK06_017770 [Gossypium arboreum]|uniref:RNase H type-1 domain-containing protein n=1 Tax=Gossypium arboreum TaxID=29729 RepID=A0ABR0Q3J5_GOSAR|nr:hypothetical protein PVK06_017770 [Gossypium arboreum]
MICDGDEDEDDNFAMVVLLPELCAAFLTQYFLELNASVFLASGQKVVLASSLHASRYFFGYAAIYYQEHPGLTWRHHKPCWYINCLKQVCSFSVGMSKDNIFKVEARVVVAWGRGLRQVEVECNNALLVELLLVSGSIDSRMVELHLIHSILNHEWKVRIRHVSRSQNVVADHMARLAVSSPPSIVVFEESPISVQGILLADKRSFHGS